MTATGQKTLDPAPQRQRRARQAPHGDLSDHALVECARRADASAFEALMRRYNRRLFRVARSILRDDAAAQDAVQEAYIRAFTHLERYEPTGRFGAWLTRICVNEALMSRRRLRTDVVSIDEVDEATLHSLQALEAESHESFDAVDLRQLRRVLEKAVDTLPEVFRTVFMLRSIEQLSVSETAESLGLNESTVKTRLHRANRRLRADLARRLKHEQLNLFEFLGDRCDRMVANVLERLRLAITPRPDGQLTVNDRVALSSKPR